MTIAYSVIADGLGQTPVLPRRWTGVVFFKTISDPQTYLAPSLQQPP